MYAIFVARKFKEKGRSLARPEPVQEVRDGRVDYGRVSLRVKPYNKPRSNVKMFNGS